MERALKGRQNDYPKLLVRQKLTDFTNVEINFNYLALFLLGPRAPRQQQGLHSNPAHIQMVLPTKMRDGHLNSKAAFTRGINVDQPKVFPEIKTLTRILDKA